MRYFYFLLCWFALRGLGVSSSGLVALTTLWRGRKQRTSRDLPCWAEASSGARAGRAHFEFDAVAPLHVHPLFNMPDAASLRLSERVCRQLKYFTDLRRLRSKTK